MGSYSIEIAARRAGSSVAELRRLAALGLLDTADDGGYGDAEVRRVQLVQTLQHSGMLIAVVVYGMPIEQVAQLVRDGGLSLDVLDGAISRVFAAMSDTTFEQLSGRSGIPVETLLGMRVATGGVAATPTDHESRRREQLQARPPGPPAGRYS